MWFRGGRWLACDLNEDADETGAVLHGYFIGEAPGRILQKGVGEFEGAHRDVTLAVAVGNTPDHPGIAIHAVIAHETTGGQRRESQVILRGTSARVRVVLADEFLQNTRSAA